MSNIEEDIKRCEKLTEPQNANWIGISNQLAIAGALARIQELEEENRIYVLNGNNVKLELYIKENYIPVQKVKDKIEELKQKRKKEPQGTVRDFILVEEIKFLEELLEEK